MSRSFVSAAASSSISTSTNTNQHLASATTVVTFFAFLLWIDFLTQNLRAQSPVRGTSYRPPSPTYSRLLNSLIIQRLSRRRSAQTLSHTRARTNHRHQSPTPVTLAPVTTHASSINQPSFSRPLSSLLRLYSLRLTPLENKRMLCSDPHRSLPTDQLHRLTIALRSILHRPQRRHNPDTPFLKPHHRLSPLHYITPLTPHPLHPSPRILFHLC